MSIRTKIDFSGITSDNIVTSDNKKYIHEDDEIFNSLKDEIAACENAQVQTELATLQILEIKEQTKVIANEAIDTATNRAETAAQNAETAVQNVEEIREEIRVIANEAIDTATNRAETAAENAENAQALAETAAINALEAERNVTETAENIVDIMNDIMSAEGEIRITAPHSLGDFYFSIISHMPEGVLPLNGSEVSRVTYSDLYDYVLNIHNELVANGKKFIVSEEEWQNISIENNGYVPYYSYGTTDGMFRLPRMSGYLKATGEMDEAGNYITEGLPNITGHMQMSSISNVTYGTGITDSSGAIVGNYQTKLSSTTTPSGTNANSGFDFDASKSNSIYGNSTHVTPETNTLFVGVWALTAFTQVGTANLNEIKEIINQSISILGDSLPLLSSRYDNSGLETSAWKLSDGSWLDGRIYTDAYNKILQRITEGDTVCLEMKESELLSTNEFPENFLIDTENVKFRLPLFVVNERTIIKEWQEGTEWYTIYSDGYIEQGGEVYPDVNNVVVTHTVNLLVPFKNTDYNVTKSIGVDAVFKLDSGVGYVTIFNYTTTSFDTISANLDGLNRFRWKACGHGEIPPREEWEIDFNYYFKVSHGVDEGRINIEEKLTEFEETAYTRLDEVVEEVSKDYVVHVDKQVGELYFSFDNYCPDGVIPLDGRLVSRTTYADLWEWVQEKGLVKDDALITTNDENTVSIFNEDGTIRYCQWYGSGDGELTFRMPKINGYLGATGDNSLAGQYIAEGLPNITGNFNGASLIDIGNNLQPSYDGALYYPDTTNFSNKTPNSNLDDSQNGIGFDASRSNSIYGNSEHVTPETNTLFIGVWAITATKAAVFDMRDVEEALKSAESYLMNNVPLMSSRWDRDGLGNLGWVKADGSWVDGRHYTGAYNYCVEKLVSGHNDFIDGQVAAISEENFDKFIVDRINKRFRLPISNGQRQLIASYKEGTEWYNIYSDGWIEQGGQVYHNATEVHTVKLLVPYKNADYIVSKSIGVNKIYTDTSSTQYVAIADYTTTSFNTKSYSSDGLNTYRWVARGYGEVLSVSSPLRALHLYFKLAHEFYVPAQAELQEKLDLIDNLVAKTDINLPTLSSRWDNVYAENIGWVKSEGQWLNGNVYRAAYDLMMSRIGINDKFVAATVGTELTDENADKFLIDTAAVKFRLPLINGERVLVYKTYQDNEYGHNAVEIYSDGYCEQRYCYWANATSGILTLLHPFIDTQYNVSIAQEGRGADDTGGFDMSSSLTSDNGKTTTSIKLSIESKGCRLYITLMGKTNRCDITDYNCGNYLFFKLADEVPSTVIDTQQVIEDLKTECDRFRQTLETLMSQGHFVIESNVSENGNNWYRKYSDGWIEQGGKGLTGNTYEFPIPFTTIPTFTHGEFNDGGNNQQAVGYNQLSSTGFSLRRYSGGVLEMYWRACGY